MATFSGDRDRLLRTENQPSDAETRARSDDPNRGAFNCNSRSYLNTIVCSKMWDGQRIRGEKSLIT